MKSARFGIRPLAREDRAAWGALWAGYLDFYGTARPEAYKDAYFARLLSGDRHDYRCLVAETPEAGRPVGLAHFLMHAHGWQEAPTCYLQDLYVAPEARGTGAGRGLIEAVYYAADVAGAEGVYWTTQHFNDTARGLYDRVGELTPFVKYQRRRAPAG